MMFDCVIQDILTDPAMQEFRYADMYGQITGLNCVILIITQVNSEHFIIDSWYICT